MTNLTQLIERLRSLEAKATKGPWRSSECNVKDCWCRFIECDKQEKWGGVRDWIVGTGELVQCDADLIAESRNALPTLLSALEESEAKAERLQRQLHLAVGVLEFYAEKGRFKRVPDDNVGFDTISICGDEPGGEKARLALEEINKLCGGEKK